MKNFFAFRTMISATIIKVLYVVGMLGITVGSIFFIVENIGELEFVFYGLSGLIVGNLFWRLVTEYLILFFSIHETLQRIDSELFAVTRELKKLRGRLGDSTRIPGDGSESR